LFEKRRAGGLRPSIPSRGMRESVLRNAASSLSLLKDNLFGGLAEFGRGGTWFRVQGLGFRVQVVRFRIEGSRFGVWGSSLGFTV